MRRGSFEHDRLFFSFLDHGEPSDDVLLLLHAHWMGASDFEQIIPQLSSRWRVVALDQRGHGHTAHGGAHSVAGYIGDIDAFLAHLSVTQPVVILGHSFGGMVANLYAAAKPDRVRGLIMEDIDVARDDHDDFMLAWSGSYPTREALEAKIGERLTPYLQKSITRDEKGWRLTFDPEEILASERALNGDHWAAWLTHRCPALVIQGTQSKVVPGEKLAEMVQRRARSELVAIDAGHSVHVDAPQAFVQTVDDFLASLETPVSRPPASPRSRH